MERENECLSWKNTTFHCKIRKKIIFKQKMIWLRDKGKSNQQERRKITQIGLSYWIEEVLPKKYALIKNFFNLGFNQRNFNYRY